MRTISPRAYLPHFSQRALGQCRKDSLSPEVDDYGGCTFGHGG